MPAALGIGIVIEHQKHVAAWLHGPPHPTVHTEFVRHIVVLSHQVPAQVSREGHIEIELPDMHGKLSIREGQPDLTIDRPQIEPGTGPSDQFGIQVHARIHFCLNPRS